MRPQEDFKSQRQSIERNYQSCESIKSMENQRVISELKQFIKNSSEKNPFATDSVCSLQVSELARGGNKST
jgi:hypothetical protein